MGETRYQALRTISGVLRVLAWIMLVGCGLVCVGSLVYAAVNRTAEPLVLSLMAALYGVLGFVYLYACAEGICVFLDIEANTRRAAELLEQTVATGRPPEA